MKKSKKIMIGAIGVIIVFIVLLLGIKIYFDYKTYQEVSKDDKNSDLELLMNKIPTEVLVYGKDISFEKGMKYKRIDTIDEHVFDTKQEYIYLIINDMDGTSGVTYEELQLLKTLLDKNQKANLIYLGTKQLQSFMSIGYYNQIPIDDAEGFAYVVYEGCRIDDWGIWTTEDNNILKIRKEYLSDVLINYMAQYVRWNES